jgi:hypothetical protein
MEKTGLKKMFRVKVSPQAYNKRIPLWDGNALTGWVIETENSFAVFNTKDEGAPNFEGVVLSRIPMGHMRYDPGRQAYVPIQDQILIDVQDARQIGWARQSSGAEMYAGLADIDPILVSDIYLSRTITADPFGEQDVNVLLILEQVKLTELESVVVSAKNMQLGMSSQFGLFTHG